MRTASTRLLLGAGLLLAALVSLALPGATFSRPAFPAAPSSAVLAKLHGALADQVARAAVAAPAHRYRVIVHLRAQADLSTWPAGDRPGALRTLRNVAATTQPAVTGFLAQAGMQAQIYQTYWIFNGFAVEAPAATVLALAARDDVAYLLEDGVMTMPKYERVTVAPDDPTSNWNIYQVNAPQTWALGYDGTGRVVANIDSGVQGDHPALVSRWRGIQPGHTPADSWFDPYGLSPNFPSDPNGHGTHTMGTIAGYEGTAAGPNEIGQAKGATWIAARNYDASGKGPFSYIHATFQFMADPDGNPNTNDQPDAVGNSWGDSLSYSYPDLEWYPDIIAWQAVGVIPVFSNGNNGPNPSTAGKPGSYPINLGIGAVNVNRLIAGFSSRGPAPNLPPWNDPTGWPRTNWGLIKPDITAPGVGVRSSLPGSGYGNNSGTSMAAPHVAGMAGLLRQVRGDLTYDEFYNIILDTAYYQASFGARPNNTYGWGEIDDYAAAVYIRDAGAIRGTITDGACAVPVIGADVRVYRPCADVNSNGECGIRHLLSDNSGAYRTILAAGTYTVSVTAPGYYPLIFPASVMSSTTNTLPLVLNRQASGTLTGLVTSGGYPVMSATVGLNGLSLRATTNAQGRYTLPAVPVGAYTVRAQLCGYTDAVANVNITYAATITQNLVLGNPTVLIADDFEDGDMAGWTITNPTTGVWHNSTVRAMSGTHAARAGDPSQPSYNGAVSTIMTSAAFDTAAADRVSLAFNIYDSAESEYDVFKADVSPNGTTWTTVWGQASPVHGWQVVCLDLTAWKSATMQIRFSFTADGSNWNNEVFEGPSVDDVRLTMSGGGAGPTATPLPARTPTPGTPIPCTPIPIPSATPCTITFSDVDQNNPFYSYIRCLACRQIVSGYADGTFRWGNEVTRGQLAKIIAGAASLGNAIPSSQQTFSDVPSTNTFWLFIERLSGIGAISGYACGGAGEPCDPQNRPYFRWGANATRGQISKITGVTAGWNGPIPTTQQTFEDVPPTNAFWLWIEELAGRQIISGYTCGGPGEPCGPGNRPYFRWGANATRGQIAKIAASAFYPNCQTPQR